MTKNSASQREALQPSHFVPAAQVWIEAHEVAEHLANSCAACSLTITNQAPKIP